METTTLSEEQITKLTNALANGFAKVISSEQIANNRKRVFAIISNYQVQDSATGELHNAINLLTQDGIGNIIDGIEEIHIRRAVGQVKLNLAQPTVPKTEAKVETK